MSVTQRIDCPKCGQFLLRDGLAAANGWVQVKCPACALFVILVFVEKERHRAVGN